MGVFNSKATALDFPVFLCKKIGLSEVFFMGRSIRSTRDQKLGNKSQGIFYAWSVMPALQGYSLVGNDNLCLEEITVALG